VLANQQEGRPLKREVERKRTAIERQSAGLHSDYEAEAVECGALPNRSETSTLMLTTQRAESGRLRQADGQRGHAARGAKAKHGTNGAEAHEAKTIKRRAIATPRRPPDSGNCAYT